jgi:hypothetical protein
MPLSSEVLLLGYVGDGILPFIPSMLERAEPFWSSTALSFIFATVLLTGFLGGDEAGPGTEVGGGWAKALVGVDLPDEDISEAKVDEESEEL